MPHTAGATASAARPTLPVTVVIPVKNEEKNLPSCLDALGPAWDEIVVVDSASSDRTAQIAAERGVRLVDFRWNGKFPKKRNWFLDNHETRNDWCLFLDADEAVTPAFIAEVERALRQEGKVGFWLTYTNYFLGRPLRHGVPQRKLALFRKSAGRYEKIDEDHWSQLDMEVHEHPQLTGEVGEIGARIDHRDFQGIGKFVARHLDYAKWEMARYSQLRNSLASKDLTPRQKAKYGNIESAWFAPAYFCFSYFVKFGFLDGLAGFQYSFYKAWYFNTIRLMIKEERNHGSTARFKGTER